MIRHVVMFRWKAGTAPDRIAAFTEALHTLPGLIPEIRDYRFGADLGVNPGNFDMVVTGDFDTVDGYLAYRDHPEHQRIIRELIAPVVEQRSAVQFEC